MVIAKKISGRFYLLLTTVTMALLSAGCISSNASAEIRSLEETVNSLKSNVTTLQNDLNEVQTKNKALENELQGLKEQVNSLKISSLQVK